VASQTGPEPVLVVGEIGAEALREGPEQHAVARQQVDLAAGAFPDERAGEPSGGIETDVAGEGHRVERDGEAFDRRWLDAPARGAAEGEGEEQSGEPGLKLGPVHGGQSIFMRLAGTSTSSGGAAVADQELKDISIIGGGPTGLFAAFYAGMRGASARIIDALPALGGQLMALYPEKYIFDVAGFPKILAKDLVRDMAAQGLQFGASTHLGEIVTGLRRVDDDGIGHFVLETSEGDYPSRTIVIAAGIGAFEARRLGIEGEDRFEEKGLYFKVLDPREFVGKKVLLVGGGDSAFDWAVNLQGVASSVMLIHRRDGFRAHQATINQVQELHQQGQCDLRTFWEVKELHGNGRVESVTIRNSKTKEEETFDVDAVIPLLGFHSDLGAIKEWGLDTEKADIKVDQVMATNVPGIYAAGDITSYPGKLKLIATGAGEACIAVNNAVHYINPKTKVNPGHSSNLAIFGQKED
jgi:thioredoxin reductase (NADPH)